MVYYAQLTGIWRDDNGLRRWVYDFRSCEEAKIAAGKKIKSHKGQKTVWMKWDNLIRNTEVVKPEVDSNIGVLWGVTKEKGKKKNKKKSKENKTD